MEVVRDAVKAKAAIALLFPTVESAKLTCMFDMASMGAVDGVSVECTKVRLLATCIRLPVWYCSVVSVQPGGTVSLRQHTCGRAHVDVKCRLCHITGLIDGNPECTSHWKLETRSLQQSA